MKFNLTTESQPPASPSCRLYEPEAIGPTPRRESTETCFFVCRETTANEKYQCFDKKIILDQNTFIGSPKVLIFFAHRRLLMSKKIKILCALRGSVVKKYTAYTSL